MDCSSICSFVYSMILKKYTQTFCKASKNIEAEVCTNRRIFLRLKILVNSMLMTAKSMKQIKNIGISQKLKIFLLDCFKLFPIFKPIPRLEPRAEGRGTQTPVFL